MKNLFATLFVVTIGALLGATWFIIAQENKPHFEIFEWFTLCVITPGVFFAVYGMISIIQYPQTKRS